MNRRHWLAWALGAGAATGAWPGAWAAGSLGDAHAGPWCTQADGEAKALMLGGHDAVGYVEADAAQPGDPAIVADWAGLQWRFTSEARRSAFLADPWRYAPQFGGFCALGMAMALPWDATGGPDAWRLYRGRLYVFASPEARDAFELETEIRLAQAHAYWRNEVMGHNPWGQRALRFVFRVPHYRTDHSLRAEWQERLAAGTLPVPPGGRQVVPR